MSTWTGTVTRSAAPSAARPARCRRGPDTGTDGASASSTSDTRTGTGTGVRKGRGSARAGIAGGADPGCDCPEPGHCARRTIRDPPRRSGGGPGNGRTVPPPHDGSRGDCAFGGTTPGCTATGGLTTGTTGGGTIGSTGNSATGVTSGGAERPAGAGAGTGSDCGTGSVRPADGGAADGSSVAGSVVGVPDRSTGCAAAGAPRTPRAQSRGNAVMRMRVNVVMPPLWAPGEPFGTGRERMWTTSPDVDISHFTQGNRRSPRGGDFGPDAAPRRLNSRFVLGGFHFAEVRTDFARHPCSSIRSSLVLRTSERACPREFSERMNSEIVGWSRLLIGSGGFGGARAVDRRSAASTGNEREIRELWLS